MRAPLSVLPEVRIRAGRADPDEHTGATSRRVASGVSTARRRKVVTHLHLVAASAPFRSTADGITTASTLSINFPRPAGSDPHSAGRQRLARVIGIGCRANYEVIRSAPTPRPCLLSWAVEVTYNLPMKPKTGHRFSQRGPIFCEKTEISQRGLTISRLALRELGNRFYTYQSFCLDNRTERLHRSDLKGEWNITDGIKDCNKFVQ